MLRNLKAGKKSTLPATTIKANFSMQKIKKRPRMSVRAKNENLA